MHRILAALLLLAAGTASATDSGGVTVTIRDPNGVGLPLSAGSNVDCYNQPSFTLTRVGTSYAFNDAAVDVNIPGQGYTVTGWARDWIPKTVANFNVNTGATTVITMLLQRPVLGLAISPTTIASGGGAATATVTLKDSSGTVVTLRNNVTVTATSSDTGKATVTQPATIAAGSSSATFTVTGVASGTATISVSSGTWGSAGRIVTISP